MSAKFPRGYSNIFKHILCKDNEFAHLLCQVTDVTASELRNFETNLRIYTSLDISN